MMKIFKDKITEREKEEKIGRKRVKLMSIL